MAIEAELADGRILEFPDGTDPKVIQSAVKRMIGAGETTIGGNVKEAFKGVVPGAIGLLETAGVGAAALLPEEYEKPTREFIKEAAATGRKPFEAAPGYEESVGRKLGEGIGSTGPFFLMGPAGVAGRLAGTGLGVAAGAGEARLGAEAKGATAEERRTATQLGAPVGLFDILAPQIGPLKGMITTALARGGVEGATEAAQKIAQNLIAKGVYDPKQDVLAGSAEEGAYGAGVGALTSLIIDMALGRRAKGAVVKNAPAETPQQEAEVTTEEKPLALGMNQPFTPVSLPDGSVAMTQADLDAFEKSQFEQKYAPQPADMLALGLSEPFSPVALPDGSVALTKADLDAYEEEQFQKKYSPQPNLNTVKAAETPPQLGFSPLSGVPKVAPDGTVLLTPEQEFKARYAPQKQRLTTEAWNSMSPEEKDAAVVKAQLEERQRIEELAAAEKGTRKEAGFKSKWTPEEKAEMGITEAPKPVKPTDRYLNPENIGVNNQLIDEGAKPFADRKEANEASKNQPMMKPLKLPKNQGYVLTPKTQQEIDRENEIAKKRSVVNVGGKPGEPIGAAQHIAGEGGLSPDMMSDMNTGGNYQLGLAWMFRPSGMSLEQAKSSLVSAGYLADDATESDVIAAIKGNALAPEGIEMNAEKQIEQQRLDAEKEAAISALESPEAYEMGYPITAQEIAQDYLDRAAEAGIDVSEITEQAFEDTRGQSEEAYYDRVSELTRNAMSGVREVKSASAGGGGQVATKEQIQMEKDLTGKTLIQAAQYAVQNAPNGFYKFVAGKVLKSLQELQRLGVNLEFKVEGGNRRSGNLYGAKGITKSVYGQQGKPTSISISLNGAPVMKNQNGYPSGMNYKTLLHELLHSVTMAKIQFLPNSSPIVKELNSLYNVVVREYNSQFRAGTLPPFLEDYAKRKNNALEDADELLTWGMTDENMQEWLSSIKVGEKTLMSKIVDLVRQIIGMPKSYETALDRLVHTSDQIIDIDLQELENGMLSKGYSLGKPQAQKIPTQQQSLFSKQVPGTVEKSLQFGKKKEGPTPTGAGIDSLNLLDSLGRGPKEADATGLAKAKQAWDNAVENPKATAEAATATTTRWLDRLETWAFSSDAGLQNRIRRAIAESTLASKERIGALLNASLSQTVHSDAVASLFLRKGGIKYNDELHKWEGVDKDDNFIKLSQQLDALAEKNGLTKEQAELIGHTAFEAKRYRSMLQFNAELQQKIDEIRAEAAAKRATSPVAASALSEKASRMQAQFKFVSDQQKAMIEPGMKLFKLHPELNDVVKTWNEIRANAVEAMVSTGFWSQEQAEEMLSNADYVPFYREEELGDTKDYGPKEFIRGLQVQKDKRLKGSERPVADIFDNQVRWVQYSINRAVRNRSAVALVDTAVDIGAARKVDERKGNDNVVRVWRNGEESFYSMDDPMFVEAFTGLEAIVIPSWKWASNMANTLRQTVVMYPLFSVAQVPQDSFAAIFSSGLKPQYALRIPILAVKEFIQTIRGKSSTHEQLKNVGAVGVRDFTSAMVRMDAEIYAGLKAPPGVLGKLKYGLNHIAMAADNAVRQAVYDASMAQGLSRAEAIEKSFEVFNVRRKGSSKSLALAGQVIPFFNAYLAAQNVAYKTITGRGISPTERADAFKTLLATTGSVMTLSLLYAMMNGDDDDYNKKPATQRDRLLMIPGTGGLSIPLRNDLFTFPKIITEHMYLMMTDKGYEDGRKFRDSMSNALGSALLGPTAVPQAIKPFVEVAINYDFFQGRPLVGTFQKGMETERQFNESTSELGKLFGKTGLISPIGADHLIRGMFGSAGGLVIYMTNPILFSDPNVPRPSLSDRDAIAALPGMSGFMSKSYESALKKDFFVLKEEVDKAANTLNDLKKRSPQDIQGFLSNEENLARVGLQKTVNKISEDLSKIRGAVAFISNSDMPADQKQMQLEQLREVENQMLKGIDVKALRALGKL